MMKFGRVTAAIFALILASRCFGDTIHFAADQLRRLGGGKCEFKFADNGIHLRIDDPSYNAGLEIDPSAAEKTWDLSHWEVLAVDVQNLSAESQARLLMTAATSGPEKKDNRESNVGIALNPGETRTIRLKLPHLWKYGAPQGVPGVRTLDTTRIARISFGIQWPFEHARPGLLDCRLTNLRTEGSLEPTPQLTVDQYLPFIDRYGQFIHFDWPQKIHWSADLQSNLAKEKAELDADKLPEEWDKYGGWKNGPQLKATGNFRTEKYQGKWYFVDPDGRLFISQGLDVLSTYNDALRVQPGKENWYQSLPAGANSYQATDVCLSEKYGTPDYQSAYFNNLSRRLQHWGMNTIGNWSRSELIELDRTPYTLELTDYDWKMPRLGSSKLKFYDVFDPVYIKKMQSLVSSAAAKNPSVTKSLTDPMCIGYFIDNELNFGNRGKMILVDEILKCPAKQASKQEFARDLAAKYSTIEKLNAAWQTKHKSWDDFLQSTEVPHGEAYEADAQAFFEKVLDQYFRLAHDAVKSVAPQRLYLGCRFISTDGVRPALAAMSKKYCDVLSTNIYSATPANFPSSSDVADNFPDMPVLIGEFQFGVLDRGMFSASLCNAGPTQADRAAAYTRFMQGVLAHPNVVGAHYFQYRDQPLVGRGDGENYQIGFVDVADTPYEELCKASRVIGENLYRYRSAGSFVAAK